MGFDFNAGKIASGLTSFASSLAYGTNLASQVIGGVSSLGSAVGSLFGSSSGSYSGSGGGSGVQLGSYSGFTGLPSGLSPTQWINSYIDQAYSENGIIRYLYQNLFRNLQPDISGYVLLFMSPPVLSGYTNLGNQNYDISGTSFMTETAKLYPLLATNFTPPTIQLNSGTLAGSSGTQHYAQELSITDSMSVTYLDTIALDIYQLHKSWLQYIFQVTEGTLEPSDEYLTGGRIDYCASFYFVKFMPNVSSIQYVGKAVEKTQPPINKE